MIFLPLKGEEQRVNAYHIESQVGKILANMDFHWEASSQAERELWPIMSMGTEYLECDKLEDAATVFRSIIMMILEDYESLYDNESELAGIVQECVEALGRCLVLTDDPDQRKTLIEDIFEVFRWDSLEKGGYGMSDPSYELLLKHTNNKERLQIIGWIQDMLSLQTDVKLSSLSYREVERLTLGLLEPLKLKDVELEQIYVQTGMRMAYLELLLEQKRFTEAIELLRKAPSDQVYDLAKKLSEAGLAKRAVEVVHEHICVIEPSNQRVHKWLKSQAAALPNSYNVLRESLLAFQSTATLKRYRQLREAALVVGRWAQVLDILDEISPKSKGPVPVRARIHADRGLVHEALSELETLKDSPWRTTAVDVAASLEETHPRDALQLYRALLEEALNHGTKYALNKAEVYKAKISAIEALKLKRSDG